MTTLEDVITNATAILVAEFESVDRTAPDSITVNVDDRPVFLTFAEHVTDDTRRVFLDVMGEIETLWPCIPGLVEWTVRNGFGFMVGSIEPTLSESGDDISLLFRYRMLANDVTPDALCVAVKGVAESTNELYVQFHEWYLEHM